MHHKILVNTVGALALVAAAVLPAAAPGQLALPSADSSRLETASSAIPTAANPVVSDTAQGAARISASPAKAVASSVATSNCDGCDAQSTTLQVVYFDGSTGASADNTATAWSSCVGCASSAVSVQLVVAHRSMPVTVNNRALALNAVCAGCTTTSAAIQFVVAGDTKRELSEQAKVLIARIQAQLADRMTDSSADQGQQKAQADSLATETAKKLESVIISDLGPASVQRLVDVQVGQ
jgi:Fe-S cluster biogenesis protein NfuA